MVLLPKWLGESNSSGTPESSNESTNVDIGFCDEGRLFSGGGSGLKPAAVTVVAGVTKLGRAGEKETGRIRFFC
ncbi:hypothetical protein LINPERPRIM_LOCUS36368 [Linum perenne]